MKRAKLVETLEVVGRALERNNVVPMYDWFCFTGKTVFAWNQIFGIVAHCEMEQPFAVDGKKFLEWLKASKEENVEFEFDEGLLITAGNASYTPLIKGPEDFVWSEPTMTKGGELDHDVIAGIEHCIPTTSDNLALIGYSLVYLGTVDGKVVVYSTDGDAMTRYATDVAAEVDVCLDKSFCNAIVKTGGGKLLIGNEWVCSLFGDFKVYGRNMGTLKSVFKDSSTPDFDYEKYIELIVEGSVPEKLTTFPLGGKLQNALTQIRTVTDIETNPTSFFIEKNKMTIVATTPFGELFDEIKLNDKHPDTECEVHASLFQKAMENCNEFRILPKACAFRGKQLLRLVSIL